MREALALHKDLARKLEALERQVGTHDVQIQELFDALRKLIQGPEKPKRRIGYIAEEKRAVYRVLKGLAEKGEDPFKAVIKGDQPPSSWKDN